MIWTEGSGNNTLLIYKYNELSQSMMYKTVNIKQNSVVSRIPDDKPLIQKVDLQKKELFQYLLSSVLVMANSNLYFFPLCSAV